MLVSAVHATTTSNETVLYSFCSQENCADGAEPYAGLVMDSAGNLYGTTWEGGVTGCSSTSSGCGTVFKLAPDGTETVLYSFCSWANCTDGKLPYAGLVMDSAGNLYGTTAYGGTGTNCAIGQYGSSCGTVFEIAPNGTETVLHSFTGYPTDGSEPFAGLVMDSAGNLYGTTLGGGMGCPALGCGAVFKLAPNGTETALYSSCPPDAICTGGDLFGSLIEDSAGNLYGAAPYGGASNGGTVFEIAPNGTETVLHSFTGNPDGANPYAGLVMDSAGNLYGTTTAGGGGNCAVDGGACGTVFKVNPTTGAETVLYSFCSQANCADGADPIAGLVMDSAGNLYGTTWDGGKKKGGTVFKLAPDGTETVLYSFCSQAKCTDGANPYAGLILDNAGHLYGTTRGGGAKGGGTVFKIAIPAAKTTTTLISWPNPSALAQAVTFSAAVSSSIGTPPDGETVSFEKDGSVMGSGTLSGGSASFTTSSLPKGTTSVTAVYGGDVYFAGSKSKVLRHVVKP